MSDEEKELHALTSHQLKTPLGIIRGYTALLREGHYGAMDGRAKEVVAKIELAAEEMVKLVDNVIDLRKVEEGRVEYQMENLDFVKLARQAADELGHLALGKGLNLSFEAPEKAIMVYGDGPKLRHVIENLIDNAVKYTERGFVRVTVTEADGGVALAVADSGIGLSAAVQPLLFDGSFPDERLQREIRGSGLGLHVAKIFIEAHHGTIGVVSEGEDKGSIFTFNIPKVIAPPAAAASSAEGAAAPQ